MGFLKTATLCLGLGVLVASAYIVKEGDTLWDLSDEFLNDPFAWPDLWENNRHIQDPHWIYPGDSIYFGDSTREDQPVIPTSQNRYPCGGAIADTNLPKGVSAVGCDDKDARNGDFENMLGDLRNRDKRPKKVKKEEDVYLYRQRPAPKIFNGYYQILAPEIYDVEDLKNDESFFSIRSGERKEPILHIPEMEVVVGIGKKTDIKAKKGDLVEILDARAIDVPGTRGKSFDTYAMLRLSGYAKITAFNNTATYNPFVYYEVNQKPQWSSNSGLRFIYNSSNTSSYYSTSMTSTWGAGLGGETEEGATIPPYLSVYMWKRTA